jgi:hypothetical protein
MATKNTGSLGGHFQAGACKWGKGGERYDDSCNTLRVMHMGWPGDGLFHTYLYSCLFTPFHTTFLSWLSSYGCSISFVPSQLPYPPVMFWGGLSLSCPVPAVFSGCPVQAVLSRLSSPNCTALAFLSPALLPLLSCLCCQVLIALSYSICFVLHALC